MIRKDNRQGSALAVVVFFLFTIFFVSGSDAQTASGAALRLIGTAEGGNVTGAVFQDTAGKQTFFKIHEKLPDGSRIVKIRDDSIVLNGEDGAVYEMYISHEAKTASPASTGNTERRVSEAAVDRAPEPSMGRYTPTAKQQASIDKKNERLKRLKLDSARRENEEN